MNSDCLLKIKINLPYFSKQQYTGLLFVIILKNNKHQQIRKRMKLFLVSAASTKRITKTKLFYLKKKFERNVSRKNLKQEIPFN